MKKVSPVRATTRPLLRGYLHLVVALVAPIALLLLLLIADSPRAYVGAAIFGSSLCLLYATSASYHLAPWRPRWRGLVQRLDHAMIFVLIAGTYTPFALGGLGGAWGITILSVVWGLAGGGMLLQLVWRRAPRWLSVGTYLGVGWVALVALAELAAGLPGAALILLGLGGLLYSVGGIVYAARWPDPLPRFFGYHEVFHTLGVGGSVVLYLVVALYVLPS